MRIVIFCLIFGLVQLVISSDEDGENFSQRSVEAINEAARQGVRQISAVARQGVQAMVDNTREAEETTIQIIQQREASIREAESKSKRELRDEIKAAKREIYQAMQQIDQVSSQGQVQTTQAINQAKELAELAISQTAQQTDQTLEQQFQTQLAIRQAGHQLQRAQAIDRALHRVREKANRELDRVRGMSIELGESVEQSIKRVGDLSTPTMKKIVKQSYEKLYEELVQAIGNLDFGQQ